MIYMGVAVGINVVVGTRDSGRSSCYKQVSALHIHLVQP